METWSWVQQIVRRIFPKIFMVYRKFTAVFPQKNMFFVEKNNTIVTFPLKNLSLEKYFSKENNLGCYFLKC
jgi:hypothetical protein